MENKNKVVIELTEKDVLYMGHTICKSFFTKFGGEDRFSVLVNNGFNVEDFVSDDDCTMHFTESYVEALLMSKVYSSNGKKAIIVSDGFIINEDGLLCDQEYIVLTNRKFEA